MHENDGEVTSGIVLNFFTGSDAVPPCVYANPPELNFSADNVMPNASTCAPNCKHMCSLIDPPSKYSNYEEFKSNLIKGISWHGGGGEEAGSRFIVLCLHVIISVSK